MSEQRIEINERFTLAYDDLGNKFLLDMKPRGKNGTINKSAYCGYHLKFEYLLKAFIKKRLPELESKTVKEALENLKQVEDEIYQLAGELGAKLQGTWKRGME